MSRILTPISILWISIATMFFPQLKAGSNTLGANNALTVNSVMAAAVPAITNAEIAMNIAELVYDSLQLDNLGLSKEALEYGVKGYQNLVNNGSIKNPDILTICDFSQSSNKKRLYVIDLKNYQLLMNTYVAHGRNSGGDYATNFSNKPDSHQSSLGFYVTENTYRGEHGLSLRIDGLDRGFNDRALERAIVVHGSNYVGDQRLQNINGMGRSYGCPAVPQSLVKKLINTIKNGTCLFIYSASEDYLSGSTILNS